MGPLPSVTLLLPLLAIIASVGAVVPSPGDDKRTKHNNPGHVTKGMFMPDVAFSKKLFGPDGLDDKEIFGPGVVEESDEIFGPNVADPKDFGPDAVESNKEPDFVESSKETFGPDAMDSSKDPDAVESSKEDPDTDWSDYVDRLLEEDCLMALDIHPSGPSADSETTGSPEAAARGARTERVTEQETITAGPLPRLCTRIQPTPQEAPRPPHAAPIGHWPWMVLFGWRAPNNTVRTIRCAGVLVGWGYALTSSLCMDGISPKDLMYSVAVILGDNITSLPGLTYNGTLRHVRRLRRHPKADLALVQLDVTAAGLPGNVRPVCLPPRGRKGPPPAGSLVEGAGWRQPGPKRSPDIQLDNDMWHMLSKEELEELDNYEGSLRENPLLVAEYDECESRYRKAPRFKIENPAGFGEDKVCAWGRTTLPRYCWCCKPPSAGWPIVIKRPGRSGGEHEYELVGLSTAQFAKVTKYCDQEDTAPLLPAVYTSVLPYRDWIADFIIS